MKKVAIFTQDTVPYNHGSGRNAHCFSKALKKSGIDVSIVSLNRNLKHPFRNYIENIAVYRIPFFVKSRFTKLLSLPFILYHYTYFIFKHDTILLYGRMTAYEYIFVLSKLLRKRLIFQSVIIGLDDMQSLVTKNLFTNKLRKWLFSLIDGYFSINKVFTDQFRNVFTSEHKIFHSYQGVDMDKFHKEVKVRDNAFGIQILSIGLIVDRKGYKELFDELAKLKIPFHFTIIGDNNPSIEHSFRIFKNEMSQIVAEGKRKLGNRITFLGPQENIARHINEADVFLFNSKQEGTPNCILEAMACKCPVVTKELAGLTETLLGKGEHAYVYSKEQSLNDILELIYKNPLDTKVKAEKAYEYVNKHANIEKVAKRFIEKFR